MFTNLIWTLLPMLEDPENASTVAVSLCYQGGWYVQ